MLQHTSRCAEPRRSIRWDKSSTFSLGQMEANLLLYVEIRGENYNEAHPPEQAWQSRDKRVQYSFKGIRYISL